ncbi:hypothetical protein I4F81_000224 [Pyropia yezoensis]|uniref:Uncharacterized protein n=1 Tax=Pyropia yezoensis TaxID=2788 RepID=A0ACC3BJ18_PYRYE|nr:hypothetical protein I4F81_000224 [Neopyropia yezoensis]
MGLFAFAAPVVLPGRWGVATAAGLRPTARPLRAAAPRSASWLRMAGRSSGGGDAPIVRAEGQALMRDQEALRRLGRGYGNFDAAGKRRYVQEMESLFERWLVMVKRLELSPDFTAQLHRRQLLDHIADGGMTFDAFVAQTRHAFAMMRTEVQD